eukprot:Gb_06096 [translate_table: standard]
MATADQLNMEEHPARSRTIDCFQRLEKLGEGTYGEVYKAKDIQTGEIVALKKIRPSREADKDGFPFTALREIKLMTKINHENVLKLKEIVSSQGPEKDAVTQGNPGPSSSVPQARTADRRGSIYMVFEYMDHDLSGLVLRPGVKLTIPQIKCYMKQFLLGLQHCHENQVLHRDIKGANLLINNHGILKIADFGLARSTHCCYEDHDGQGFTNNVVTRWYRPPELLLGATKYGSEVDIWSAGCIFGELLLGEPLVPGKTEADQLDKIFKLCGTPNESIWPGVTSFPLWKTVRAPSEPPKADHMELEIERKARVLGRTQFFDRSAIELLQKMLRLCPTERISAKMALDSEYFWMHPLPCDPRSFPMIDASHELNIKKLKEEQERRKRQKTQHPQVPQAAVQNRPMQQPPPPFPLGQNIGNYDYGNQFGRGRGNRPPRGSYNNPPHRSGRSHYRHAGWGQYGRGRW